MSVTSLRAAFAVAVLIGTAACWQTSAPPKWLPTAEESQQNAFGAWISVEQGQGKTRRVTEGELIAAHPDSIFIMKDSSLVALRPDEVRKVTLTTYDSRYGEIVMWSVLGTVATVSHGVGLLLTAPTWIIGGSTASAKASKAPRVESKKPVELRKFARFPQGIPAELDRSVLRPKPGVYRPRPRPRR